MTMDSAPARHTGQGGTGPAGGTAGTAAVRRSVTAIHPHAGPGPTRPGPWRGPSGSGAAKGHSRC